MRFLLLSDFTFTVPSHVGAKCKAENEQPITEKLKISFFCEVFCNWLFVFCFEFCAVCAHMGRHPYCITSSVELGYVHTFECMQLACRLPSGLGNDTSKTHVFYVVFYTQDLTYVEYVSQTCFCVNKEPIWLFLTYSNNFKFLVSKLIRFYTHKKVYISLKMCLFLGYKKSLSIRNSIY